VASLKWGLCQIMFIGTKIDGYLTVRPEHSDCNKKHTHTQTHAHTHTHRCLGGEVEGSVKFRVRCIFEPVVSFFKGPSGLSRAFCNWNCSLTDSHLKHQNTVLRASSIPIFNCRKDGFCLISARLCCDKCLVASTTGGAFMWVSLRMMILPGLFLSRA